MRTNKEVVSKRKKGMMMILETILKLLQMKMAHFTRETFSSRENMGHGTGASETSTRVKFPVAIRNEAVRSIPRAHNVSNHPRYR